MMLHLTYDTDRCIPVSGPDDAPAEAIARDFVARVGLEAQHIDRISAAIRDARTVAGDDREVFVIVAADGAVIAPLVLAVAESRLSQAEHAGLLWSDALLLPPTPYVVETSYLGTGFSVTMLERRQQRDLATRRWLFFGEDRTVIVSLGPVVPYGMAFAQIPVEAMLESARVDGFVAADARDYVDQLDAAAARFGEGWVA